MRPGHFAAAVAVVVAAAGTFVARSASACAPAPPPGVEVRIRGEGALIVWDPARKLEHFVRYARFETRGEAADFGFLVPTPSRPELAEGSLGTFAALEEAILPEQVREVRTRIVPTALCLAPFHTLSAPRSAAVPGGAPRQAVEVLDEVRVSGYEAAVLAANDAGALADWLRSHGYDQRPALTDWLQRYVEAGWIITAFKVTGGATAPVRLTFRTERPFYPYREPEDARREGAAPSPRSLRVFFVGPERVQGTIGDAGAWPGALEWARTVPVERLKRLVHASVPDGGLPAGDLWLSAYEDGSSPRPGTDEVFFARSAEQTPKLPPPIVITEHDDVPLPLDVILVLGVVPAAILVRRRRRPASS